MSLLCAVAHNALYLWASKHFPSHSNRHYICLPLLRVSSLKWGSLSHSSVSPSPRQALYSWWVPPICLWKTCLPQNSEQWSLVSCVELSVMIRERKEIHKTIVWKENPNMSGINFTKWQLILSRYMVTGGALFSPTIIKDVKPLRSSIFSLGFSAHYRSVWSTPKFSNVLSEKLLFFDY